MGDHDDLLTRFAPSLRYDSNEQFFADSAAQFTDAPGITLRRAAVGRAPGAVIATADGAAGKPKLSLAFLGAKVYGNGEAVEKTDAISVRGQDYRKQYAKLRIARPDLNNRIYARAAAVNGRVWLQYWLWYFYNDYQLALGFGTHEGDWECVQFRMSPDGDAPDVAVYAQHRHGEKRAWKDVEKLAGSADTPVVYVGRGSHASYFEKGYHETEAFYDLADGKRPAPKLALEIIDGGTYAWLRWPGRWGDTLPPEQDKLDLAQSSPTGPGTKKQWRNPDTLLDNAVAPKLRTPPAAPDVSITRAAGDRMRIDYDFQQHEVPPRALVVTVNSRDEKGVPPMTHTFEEVAGVDHGTIETDVVLNSAHHYDIYASTVAGDPPRPSASQFAEIDPVGTEKPPSVPQKLAQWFGRLLARIRGDAG
jgi:hypothetical protein